MLIRNAEIAPGTVADVMTQGPTVKAIGKGLSLGTIGNELDAHGNCLLPSLHDHHIHLLALARWQESVQCGPPYIRNAGELATALRGAEPVEGWIRGVGYHESVGGEIDAQWLDRMLPDLASQPLRIQHRTGRLWIFNTAGMRDVLAWCEGETPFERLGHRLTGRLYDADAWLRDKLPRGRINLRKASRLLAQSGITSVTDATPSNGPAECEFIASSQNSGDLVQDVTLMGNERLADCSFNQRLRVGPVKFHHHEGSLPPLDVTVQAIRRAHDQGREAAFHCVTLGELAFILAAFASAGSVRGDRIEHAGIVPDSMLSDIARLKLTIVSQPHFIRERGDAYRKEVTGSEQPWLYRAASFLNAGIPFAAGSDAPYGSGNPWVAMASAVERKTFAGHTLGAAERISPENAVGMFLGSADKPAVPRRIAVGHPANLCLLDRNWASARTSLERVEVILTMLRGTVIWQSPTHSTNGHTFVIDTSDVE